MRVKEFDKHVMAICIAKKKIEDNLKKIEPDKKIWMRIFLMNESAAIRKLFLDLLVLEELIDEAYELNI